MKSMKLSPISSSLRGYVCRSCIRQIHRGRRGYATKALDEPELFDVVCVGGGPAGLSLLAALRASPKTSALKIALVESQDLTSTRSWNPPSSQFSNRCSSLTPSSASFLDHIGAWNHIKHGRVQPYEEMQVWDGITGARIEFDWPNSEQEKTIAYMMENANITSALLQRLDELSGVSIYDKTRVENISLGKETEEADLRSWPIVELSGGKQIGARLLIGADGANSPVRTFAGIASKGWDYNRQGVVASLCLEEPISQIRTAYQRFLPTGPIALLPLPGPHATLVWSTTPERAALLKSLSHVDFTAMINAAFRLSITDLNYMHTIGSGQEAEYDWRIQHTSAAQSQRHIPQLINSIQPNTTGSFPLKLAHADTYIGERIALIGDAAHTTHPLAGQGLNQGQADVQSLVQTIQYAVEHGMDIGSQMSLESYNSDRYFANHLFLGVVDKLHKLYSVESGPLVHARDLGLRMVNGLGPLKGFLMNQAAGTGVKMPLGS